jgi:hypothetical protein
MCLYTQLCAATDPLFPAPLLPSPFPPDTCHLTLTPPTACLLLAPRSPCPSLQVPAPYTEKGSFWYRMVSIHFLIGTLSEKFSKKLALTALKQKLGFTHPIIGLHVRHGDSCPGTPGAFTHRSCKGVGHYIEELEIMRSLYGINKVFLATGKTRRIVAGPLACTALCTLPSCLYCTLHSSILLVLHSALCHLACITPCTLPSCLYCTLPSALDVSTAVVQCTTEPLRPLHHYNHCTTTTTAPLRLFSRCASICVLTLYINLCTHAAYHFVYSCCASICVLTLHINVCTAAETDDQKVVKRLRAETDFEIITTQIDRKHLEVLHSYSSIHTHSCTRTQAYTLTPSYTHVLYTIPYTTHHIYTPHHTPHIHSAPGGLCDLLRLACGQQEKG